MTARILDGVRIGKEIRAEVAAAVARMRAGAEAEDREAVKAAERMLLRPAPDTAGA